MINTVAWRHVAQQHRILIESQLLGIGSCWERVDGVSHLIVDRMSNLDYLLARLGARSHDYR